MKVEQAVTTYVVYKQSLGMRFVTEARTLKSFSKSVGNVDLDRIGSRHVRTFLNGNGPMTRFWHRKFSALSGFYRFCFARGHATTYRCLPSWPSAPNPLHPTSTPRTRSSGFSRPRPDAFAATSVPRRAGR